MSHWQIIQGDALTVLQTLPTGSVQCVVTSPPYYGLRDYQVEGQMGLEDRPDCAGWATGQPCGVCYVCRMTAVFCEVRRVLRDDGALWLNMGDSYANWGGSPSGKNAYAAEAISAASRRRTHSGLKLKDLIGLPWRLAFSLQADGWYLRSDIIWHKKAPMPESVKDRPTRAHEFVFLLSKSERYFYDGEAVREAASPASLARISQPNFANQTGGKKDYGTTGINRSRSARKALEGFAARSGWNGSTFTQGKTAAAREHLAPVGTGEREERPGRNLRDVWSLGPSPYPEAHFATFPPALPELCIKAGTSYAGCCPACGASYKRIESRTFLPQQDVSEERGVKGANGQKPTYFQGWDGVPRGSTVVETIGWQPTCTCEAGDPVPCTVLDPFSGAGTTGLVARRLLRNYIGIELNPAYIAMSEQRIIADMTLAERKAQGVELDSKPLSDLPLFEDF